MTAVKQDMLLRFRKPGQSMLYTPEPAAGTGAQVVATPQKKGKPAYEAFQLSTTAQRHLEIRQKFPEPAECPLNTMITNIRAEWRFGLAIDLMYGKNMLVEIKGERLLPLFEAIKEWKVVWIAEFDPQTFGPPLDAGAPYIKSITVLTERPEMPPPMSQRH